MIRRAWSLPLWAHAAALLLVAALAIGLARPGAAFFSDEGAAMVQAELLHDDGTWYVERPAVVADPEDAARPFQNGDLGTEGLAPYAKHPLYPWLLATVGAADPVAAVALSVMALAVAALGSALIARSLTPESPDLHRATMWIVGLGSPLLFAGGLVVAHTMAAACAAVAVVTALHLMTRRRSGRDLLSAGTLVVVLLLAALLRTEAIFLGPAISAGVVVSGFAISRVRLASVALLAAGASAVGFVIDRAWTRSIVGSAISAPSDNVAPRTGSWALDRLHGLYTTTIQAGYGLSRGQELALWGALLVLGVTVWAWRRRVISSPVALLTAGIAVLLYLARSTAGPPVAVPGLLVAFPFLVVAALLFDRRALRSPGARLALTTALVCLVAIALTQYPNGGGLEWGWRYAGIVLPVLVPALICGMWPTLHARPASPGLRRAAALIAVVVLVVPSALAIRVQARSHAASREVAAAMASVDDGEAGRPVVLSWNRLLPQILYPQYGDYEWVVPARDRLDEYGRRLVDAEVESVILVGPASGGAVKQLEETGWREVDRRTDAPYDVVLLAR